VVIQTSSGGYIQLKAATQRTKNTAARISVNGTSPVAAVASFSTVAPITAVAGVLTVATAVAGSLL